MWSNISIFSQSVINYFGIHPIIWMIYVYAVVRGFWYFLSLLDTFGMSSIFWETYGCLRHCREDLQTCVVIRITNVCANIACHCRGYFGVCANVGSLLYPTIIGSILHICNCLGNIWIYNYKDCGCFLAFSRILCKHTLLLSRVLSLSG